MGGGGRPGSRGRGAWVRLARLSSLPFVWRRLVELNLGDALGSREVEGWSTGFHLEARNGCRNRAFKYWLQNRLCDVHSLVVTVCHYPTVPPPSARTRNSMASG